MGVAPCERMGDEFALPLSLSVADRAVQLHPLSASERCRLHSTMLEVFHGALSFRGDY